MALDSWNFETSSTGFPIGASTYREDVNSGTGTYSEDGSEVNRVFLVDWYRWRAFVSDCLGYPTYAGGTGVSRVLPEEHPEARSFYASSCKVSPVGVSSVSGNKSEWKVARIDTAYKPVTYAVRADGDITSELDRFVTRKTLNKGDYLQLQITSFKWVSRALVNGQKQPLGASPGIVTPSKMLEYTWHRIPTRPAVLADPNRPFRCPLDGVIPLYLGRVNSTTFDGIYQPGTVLLTGAEAEMVRPVLSTGAMTWNVRYFFEVRDHGAGIGGEQAGINYIYDPLNSRWDLVTTDGTATGQRLYTAANFNTLFVVP